MIQFVERARRHGGTPPPGLAPRRPKQQCMQTSDRVLAGRARLQFADPLRGFVVENERVRHANVGLKLIASASRCASDHRSAEAPKTAGAKIRAL